MKKGKLLCITDNYKVIYRSGKVFVTDLSDKLMHKFWILDGYKRIFSLFRITERLMRLEVRCAIQLTKNQVLLSCNGHVYNIDTEKGTCYIEHSYRGGMLNPISLYKVEGNNSPEVLYGEYFWNTNKEEVYIWGRCKGEWKRMIGFPAGCITHIHQIVYNEYRDEYLVATGDQDSESGIWTIDKNFQEITPLVKGAQIYRSCFLYPTNDGIIFTTDTPLASNAIFQLTYNDKAIHKLEDIPGPCIYALKISDGFVFSTSVEPDSSLPPLRYHFTNKLGDGVSDRCCHIMRFSHGRLQELAKFEKDLMPMWLFQFGNCQFANNYTQDKNEVLYMNPCAVKKYDYKTISFNL